MISNLNRIKDNDRATILAVTDASNVNEYTIPSSVTETHPISMDHNRRLINEIIDSTFNEQKGICEVSSSECSSLKLKSSEYSYDRRLKYWKDVLKEREKISIKIRDQSNKDQFDILYNRLVTVDERDKFTVKRLMDFAQRLNPSNIITRQPVTLREKCDMEMSTFVPELQETLPQTERRENAQIEIVALPKVTKEELLGKTKYQGNRKPFSWLESKHLANLIDDCSDDIKRVIEYYPDTENLQIVGESLLATKLCEKNSEIQSVSCKDICNMSDDTPPEGEVPEEQTNLENAVELPDYAFKINEQEFIFTNYRCYRNFKTLTNFSCFPFQTEVKKIFTIQNIGRKVLTFQWVYRSFYARNSSLFKCSDNEFVFDTMPFRLCSGEALEVFVMFQPRQVGIVKSKWILKVKPTLFKRKVDGITMSLSGVCAVPPEYEKKLEKIQREIIDKSNKRMIKEITTKLSTLAVDLQACDCICPYQRSLNKMELFEQLNAGFKCERYNDLELLEELYKRIKKPRNKVWDLQVNTIKTSILNLPKAESRALFFNELCNILNTMEGNSVNLEEKILDNTEEYRSRLLYVRGIISTALDEWVELASTLEETFCKADLQSTKEELAMQDAEELEINENRTSFSSLLHESENRQYTVLNHVRKLKSYRDALYMQTYSLFCDFVENIVNVIESTV